MFKLEKLACVTGFGTVNCCVAFKLDHAQILLFGTSDGLFETSLDEEESRPVTIIPNTPVTMCDTFGSFLIVLANHRLLAYRTETIVAVMQDSKNMQNLEPKELRDKHIEFFRVGMVDGEPHLFMMHRKRNDSIIRSVKLSPPDSREPFETSRDFFLPGEPCSDMTVLKKMVAFHKPPGFEIMDPTSFRSVTIPQKDDKGLTKEMHRRLASEKKGEPERPLGIYKVNEEEFILCYEGFGLFVTSVGDASRGGDHLETGGKGKVEWTERANQVACYASHLFLFGGVSGCIEVRHAETGELAQTFGSQGSTSGTPEHSRCLWGQSMLEPLSLYASVKDAGDCYVAKLVKIE